MAQSNGIPSVVSEKRVLGNFEANLPNVWFAV